MVGLQVPSKVVSMSWTSDGMLLALGLYDGSITLRDKAGSEKLKFTAGSSPVWSLTWTPGVSNTFFNHGSSQLAWKPSANVMS